MTDSGQVLHIVEPARLGDAALKALALLLAQTHPPAHTAVIIGGDADQDRARRFGVRTTDRIHTPRDHSTIAAAGLRRLLRARLEPDLLVAWSFETLAAAAAAAPDTPLILHATAPPDPRGNPLRIPRPAPRVRAVIATAGHIRAACGARGAALQRAESIHLPLPAHPAATTDRAQARAALDVPHEALLITALGDPPQTVDAFSLSFVAGLFQTMGRTAAAVIHPRALQLERALRMRERIGGVWRIAVTEAPLASILPACDVALWLGPPPAWRDALPTRCFPSLNDLPTTLASEIPVLAMRHPDVERLAPVASPLLRIIDDPHPIEIARIARAHLNELSATPDAAQQAARAVAEQYDPAQWQSRFNEALHLETAALA
ncbi:MAG: hypothetical protein VYC34_12355 [Planctomycetota bacterium]|nr:hypothetical protein [Planctomycetota bacterium]